MTNIPLTGKFTVTNAFHEPGNYKAKWHTGIDLIGSDIIYATCNGIVTRRGYDSAYGNFIVVRNDDDGKYHWFCHLSKINKNTGSKVTRTSILGIMRKHRKFKRKTSSF